jgi:hypothetical protein
LIRFLKDSEIGSVVVRGPMITIVNYTTPKKTGNYSKDSIFKNLKESG